HGRTEVALPDGPRRPVGLRQRATDDPGGPADQWQNAQSDHAGEQERLLLCARPHHRRVHFRPAILAGQLGEGDRSEDGTAHHQSGSDVRKGPDAGIAGGGGAHSWSPMSFNPQTGLVYIPTRGWDTFNYAVNYDFKPDPSRVGGASQTGLNNNTVGLTRRPPAPFSGPEPLEGGNVSTLVAYD